MQKALKFSISVFITFFAGVVRSVLGHQAVPVWYEALKKAPFNPANQIFGPVWVILYSLQALSLYLIWETSFDPKKKKEAVIFYFIQLALNTAWSIVFFALQSPMGALFVMFSMWVFVLITIIKFFKIRKLAAVLLVPYLLWISFASVLNFYIANLN